MGRPTDPQRVPERCFRRAGSWQLRGPAFCGERFKSLICFECLPTEVNHTGRGGGLWFPVKQLQKGLPQRVRADATSNFLLSCSFGPCEPFVNQSVPRFVFVCFKGTWLQRKPFLGVPNHSWRQPPRTFSGKGGKIDDLRLAEG